MLQSRNMILLDDYIEHMEQENNKEFDEKWNNMIQKGINKQDSYSHVSLISRALEKPIEVYFKNSLSFSVGFEFRPEKTAIQVMKIEDENKSIIWRHIGSKYQFYEFLGPAKYNSIYYALESRKDDNKVRQLMDKVIEQFEKEKNEHIN